MRSFITAQSLGKSAFSAHNPYLIGNLLFVAWYQAGLLIIDIKDPAAPKLVGAYDTFDEGSGGSMGIRVLGESSLFSDSTAFSSAISMVACLSWTLRQLCPFPAQSPQQASLQVPSRHERLSRHSERGSPARPQLPA
jgi:hypothetical protein